MSSETQGRRLLVVLTAPSGAGKTTLRDRLLAEGRGFDYSVSCTTRPPRTGEVDGKDYHFLTPEDFDRRLAGGEFLEYAVVHGHKYGTLRAPVEAALRAGRHVLMDIDVQGAEKVRRIIRDAPAGDALKAAFVDIFIAPPSLEALRERLVRRGLDRADVIARRLVNAEGEMRRAGEFRYRIVNDDLDRAYREVVQTIEKEARGYG